MNLSDWEYKPITTLCDVERAVQGKVYRGGTCYIKLSAVDEFVGHLKEPGEIDSRYAAMEPHEGVDTDYLFGVIQIAFPKFLRKYRTTIDLQFDTLVHFRVPWHREKECRDYVGKICRDIENAMDSLEEIIAAEKEIKRWYLENMMV